MRDVPRFHGVDEQEREVLDYLPSRVVDVQREVLTDVQLTSIGSWTRTLHQATRGFRRRRPPRFHPPPGADVVGHNDIMNSEQAAPKTVLRW